MPTDDDPTTTEAGGCRAGIGGNDKARTKASVSDGDDDDATMTTAGEKRPEPAAVIAAATTAGEDRGAEGRARADQRREAVVGEKPARYSQNKDIDDGDDGGRRGATTAGGLGPVARFQRRRCGGLQGCRKCHALLGGSYRP